MKYVLTFMLGWMSFGAFIEYRDEDTVHGDTAASIALLALALVL